MSGTRSVGVRIEANAKQAGAEIEQFATTAEAGLARVGAAGERAAAGTESQSRSLRGVAASLDRVTASVNPIEAAYQKWSRAQEVVSSAQAKGVTVTETHLRAVENLQAQYQRLAVQVGGTEGASRHLTGMATANDNAAGSASKLASNIQNASFQIGDFAVQVASGQSYVTALAQQLPQLLGSFGMIGAVSGAAVAIGAVAYRFAETAINGRDLASVLKDVEASSKALDAAARIRFESLEGEAERVERLTDYYRRLTDVQLAGERASLAREQGDLRKASDKLFSDVSGELRRASVANVGGELSLQLTDASVVRDALASMAQLRDPLNQTREAVSGVIGELSRMIEANPALKGTIEPLIVALDKNRQSFVENGEAARALAERARLIEQATPGATGGINGLGSASGTAAGQVDTLAGAAGRLSAKLGDLKAAGERARQAPGEALSNAQALLATLEKSGTKAAEALQRQQQAAGTLQQRVEAQLESEVKNRRAVLEAQAQQLQMDGKVEEAKSLLADRDAELAKLRADREPVVRQQMQETDTLLQTIASRREEIRDREAAADRAASRARTESLRAERDAANDTLKIYDRLQRDGRTGLLYGTASDDNMAREIQRALKGSALDPDERKKALDKIERDSKASQDRQQAQIERSTDNIVDYASDSFADMFDQNGRGWEGMLDTFESTARRTFSRIAAEAIIRPIITPIVTGVLGSAGQIDATGSASGSGGSLGMLSGVSKYTDAAGSAFKSFMGTGPSQTGFAYLDDVLNTPLYNTSSGFNAAGGAGEAMYGPYSAANPAGGVSVGGAIGGAAGIAGGIYGIYSGIQTGGAKGWAQGVSGTAGVIAGGTALAGGSAAVAGGAAAAGLGAGASAALGAIAAAAPYVAVIAAIAAMFLSGQKPSDMTGVYRSNLHTGTSEVDGLSGDRYSQDNRDLAAQIGGQVNSLADSLKASLGVSEIPYNFEIKAGNRDGIAALYGPGGGTWHEYERNDASAAQLVQDMAQSLIDSMKGLASSEVQSVIAHSSGVDATLANLDWYNGTYKTMIAESVTPTAAFVQQVNALAAPIDQAIAKAKELGLNEEALNGVRAKAVQTLIDQRSATLSSITATDSQRQALASGVSELVLQIQNFSVAAQAEVKTLDDQLRDLDIQPEARASFTSDRWKTLDAEYNALVRRRDAATTASSNSLWDRFQSASGNGGTLEGALWDQERRANAERISAASDGVTDMVMLEKTLAEERAAIIRKFGEQATAAEQERQQTALNAELQGLQALQSQAGILAGFLDSQALSGPGVSPEQAFLEAQRQYDDALSAARNGGDLSAYTSAANTLISTSSDYYGVSPQMTALRDMVLSTTRGLGTSLDLPGFSDNFAAGLERVMTPNTDAVTALTQEVTDLREELRSMRVRT